MSYAPELEIMADIIFVLYLIWVSGQDYKSMQVVRYSHLLGLFAIVLQLFLQVIVHNVVVDGMMEKVIAGMLACLVLLVMQIVACFMRLYGVADGIVFFLCGVFMIVEEGAEGFMQSFLWLTAVSGVLLLVVQAMKGNLKGVGLKQPVSYIPYISFAFILTKWVL